MDAKLADARVQQLDVAGVAKRQAAHPAGDLRLGPRVAHAGEPVGERGGLTDFDHVSTMGDRLGMSTRRGMWARSPTHRRAGAMSSFSSPGHFDRCRSRLSSTQSADRLTGLKDRVGGSGLAEHRSVPRRIVGQEADRLRGVLAGQRGGFLRAIRAGRAHHGADAGDGVPGGVGIGVAERSGHVRVLSGKMPCVGYAEHMASARGDIRDWRSRRRGMRRAGVPEQTDMEARRKIHSRGGWVMRLAS
jgi:hypothetical protein